MHNQTYQVTLLRDPTRPGSVGMAAALPQIMEIAESSEARYWGLFNGLFGLRSNEVYLVTAGEFDAGRTGFEVADTITLEPTVRPVEFSPPDQAGVYVFRWFTVKPESVAEITALSNEAWVSFEADFEARIQGLFVESGNNPGKMLLITWYRNLSVWEASRQPSDAARENFLRRHQLTLGAHPIATQLHGHGISLVSSS